MLRRIELEQLAYLEGDGRRLRRLGPATVTARKFGYGERQEAVAIAVVPAPFCTFLRCRKETNR